MRKNSPCLTGLAGGVGLAVSVFAGEAWANTVDTPFGEADESCVHETPMGGNIDAETGDVRVNGVVVDHFPPCTSSWKLNEGFLNTASSATAIATKTDGGTLPSSQFSGWYTWVDAQWANISGTTYPFDAFASEWQVPTNPQPPLNDQPVIYFFSSLENNQGLSNNGGGCGTNHNIAIIQPVLQWGVNSSGLGATNAWTIAAYEVYGCNSDCQTGCSVGHSPLGGVSAGHQLAGLMSQTASNPDQWQIEILDFTSGLSTYNYMTVSNSWPKFGSLQPGVMEAYRITFCADLSPANSITFINDGAYTAFPQWNSFLETDIYGTNWLHWQGWINTPNNCNGNNTFNTSTDNTTLTWVE